jgi:uncharacterized membrane protein YphA (DoxX/SURF4 family)
MNSDVLLWIGQILLAFAFLTSGYGHAFSFAAWSARPGMGWMGAVGRDGMRLIGLLEILGAIGLILPASTRVLPWLTPLAAACLAAVMVFATVFHLRRPGETRNIVLNVVLGVMAILVAYGRLVVSP